MELVATPTVMKVCLLTCTHCLPQSVLTLTTPIQACTVCCTFQRSLNTSGARGHHRYIGHPCLYIIPLILFVPISFVSLLPSLAG